jgi:hypothetical protein
MSTDTKNPPPKKVAQDTTKFTCWAAALESWIAAANPKTPQASMTTQDQLIASYKDFEGAKNGLAIAKAIRQVLFEFQMMLDLYFPSGTNPNVKKQQVTAAAILQRLMMKGLPLVLPHRRPGPRHVPGPLFRDLRYRQQPEGRPRHPNHGPVYRHPHHHVAVGPEPVRHCLRVLVRNQPDLERRHVPHLARHAESGVRRGSGRNSGHEWPKVTTNWDLSPVTSRTEKRDIARLT